MSPDEKRPADGPEPADTAATARDALAKAVGALGSAHLDSCVRCGLCAESCHVWRGEPEPENVPGVKVAKVASHFRRYHTVLGRYFPTLVGAKELTPEALDDLTETVFGRCTGCGRCSLHCTVGLDIAGVMKVGRKLLAATGRVPEGIQRTIDNQLETGNQMAISREELLSTVEWLEQDLRLEMDDESVRLPVDQEGSRVLYVINPREVKFFPLSLLAAAGVFHAVGESWTISSRFYDVTNYGYFAGDDASARELTRRIVEEARRLGVQEIILSECGHGYRSHRWEGPNWLGEEQDIPERSILQLMDEWLAEGRLKLDPAKNTDRVTLHDPCNLVRWGGLAEPQRRILAQACSEFVEMTPNRADNFCCGGGGGMLAMSEYGERRVASGSTKAEQIRTTEAKIVATPCHNCADQLLEVSKKYELGTEIQSVVELVYNALA